MIEFTLNRNRNGKKSRWAKRYPRKRILKRGSEKAAHLLCSRSTWGSTSATLLEGR